MEWKLFEGAAIEQLSPLVPRIGVLTVGKSRKLYRCQNGLGEPIPLDVDSMSEAELRIIADHKEQERNGPLVPLMMERVNRGARYRSDMITLEAARSEYNAAASKLELATIRKRASELTSQAFEYVANGSLKDGLGEITEREREIGIAFARYAISGRSDRK